MGWKTSYIELTNPNKTSLIAGKIRMGTSAANNIQSAADTNFVQLYQKSIAATGTARGIYNRLYLTSGSGGEAIRAYTTVSNNAPVDTCNGAHLSLDFGDSAGNITGLGTAARCTLHVPNRSLTGTTAAIQAELFTDGESAALGGTTSLIRGVADGGTTGKATMDTGAFFLDISASGFTGGTGKFYDTSKTTGTHTGGLRVKLPGGATGWIAVISA